MATLPQALTPQLSQAYTLANETLTSVNSDFQIQIGDSAQPTLFVPTMQIQRWPGPTALYECAFKLKWVDPNATLLPVISYAGNIVIYSTPHIDVHFYDQGFGENTGAFECEIVLKSAPASNVITFQLSSVGLAFYYQPPLANVNADGSTWELNATGLPNRKRPANVSGSYAVYHATQAGDYTALGGQNYKAGKAFHLYRPSAVDSSIVPVQTWGTVTIDTGAGTMTITLPQAFLDAAVYPVTVDPTFGYTTQGASSDDNGNTNQWFWAHTTPASNGTLTGIAAWVHGGDGGQQLAVSLYTNNAGVAGTKVASTETGTGVTGSFSTITTTLSASVTSGTQYWLGLKGSDSSSLAWAFDALGDNGSNGFQFATVATWPATATNSGQANENASIWGVYTSSSSKPTGPFVTSRPDLP